MAKKETKDNTKVLRIGIIKDRQIIHERLILPGEPVSVGPASRSTFVLEIDGIKQSHVLFEAKKGKYFLNFNTSMSGRIAAGKGEQYDLAALSGDKRVSKKGGQLSFPIQENYRGKVTMGEYSFLFQFIPAPPFSMRPQHNYAPTFFDEDDMVYFGFLGLFSMIAITFMIYVMNTEPPPILDQEELQQRFVELLDVPPPEEEVLEPEVDPNAEKEEIDEEAPPDPNAEAEAPAEEVVEEAPTEEAVEEKAEASSSMSESDKAEAEAEVEATAFIQLLGTRGEGKGAISSAFGGAGTNADLDSVLSNVTSGAVATAANQSATRGQTDKSGRASADIGVAKAGSKVSSGKVSKGPGSSGPPSGSVGVKQIETAMGECADAIKKVVRRKNAQIKYCYESRLKEDPNLRGRVVLEVTIDSGSVVDVAISKNKTGDKKLGACIKKKVRKWSFPATCSDIAMFPFALSPGS